MKRAVSITAVVLAAGLGGCGRRVTITWTRPAEVQLPPDVHALEVGPFEARGTEPGPWAKLAARALRDRLAAAGRGGRLRAAGRDAAPDARVTGSVEVVVRIRRKVPSADPRQVQCGKGDRLVCSVVLAVAVVRPAGRTLVARRLARSYDSDAAPRRGTVRTDEVAAGLIDRCAGEFVDGLLPRTLTVRQDLDESPNPDVSAGNRLAASGRYAAALESYRRALSADPPDRAARFNAGLMCELLGMLDRARRHYVRAGRAEAARRVDKRLSS